MKKISYFIISLFFVYSYGQNNYQQIDDSYDKFKVLTHGGIGFGNIKHDNAPNYVMNNNYFEVLLNYNFNKTYGLATGVGLNELSGNGFNLIGNFYHERDELRIPLLGTIDFYFTNKVKGVLGLGFYAKTIVRDEYRFINAIEEDLYDGWGFGFQSNVGILFEVMDYLSLGINFNGQADFTDFDTDTNTIPSDSQRLDNLNNIGFMIELSF